MTILDKTNSDGFRSKKFLPASTYNCMGPTSIELALYLKPFENRMYRPVLVQNYIASRQYKYRYGSCTLVRTIQYGIPS